MNLFFKTLAELNSATWFRDISLNYSHLQKKTNDQLLTDYKVLLFDVFV